MKKKYISIGKTDLFYHNMGLSRNFSQISSSMQLILQKSWRCAFLETMSNREPQINKQKIKRPTKSNDEEREGKVAQVSKTVRDKVLLCRKQNKLSSGIIKNHTVYCPGRQNGSCWRIVQHTPQAAQPNYTTITPLGRPNFLFHDWTCTQYIDYIL